MGRADGQPERTRPRRSLAACVAALALSLGSSTFGAADDTLGPYLERLRLTRLLATHLERQLAGATMPEDRVKLVERLAEVYPELLERETDPAQRDELVARSTAFLKRESPKQADPLRLSLLRARYRAASRIAEDFRAALAADAAVNDARATLVAVEKESAELRTRFDAKVRELEKRGERVDGLEGERLQERLDRARGELAEAHSLEAWGLYYRSLLSGDRALAELAQPHFAKILDAGREFPNPQEVSLDLRSNEFFANAILGMALCRARTESYASAFEWLKLLDVSQVAESIRRQLPAWQLVAAIERSEWTIARGTLRAFSPDAPAAWLRLAAVGGLRDGGGRREAVALSREAIATLAARRELGHIADLARQFGDEAIGSRGFASKYVRGVLSYESARKEREANKSEAALRSFEDAAKQLEEALTEPDVSDFAAAAVACKTMAGWSRFERGEFAAARTLFAEVSDASEGREEEAEWMALVCVEKMLASATGDKGELEKELGARVDTFVSRHPASERIPQVLLRRTTLAALPRRDDLERLLAGDGEVRRQAVGGLYKLFRAASGPEKVEIGKRFLEVSRSLPPTGGADANLDGLPGADLTLTRQALEIALSPEIGDVTYAEAILDVVDRLVSAKKLIAGPVAAELAVRRVQLDLARMRVGDALTRLSELERAANSTGDEGSRKAVDLARRHIFRFVAPRVRDASMDSAALDRPVIIDAAIRTGEGIVAAAAISAGTLEKALADASTETVATTTVQAFVEAATKGGSRELGERGVRLAQAILARRPRDPQLLELTAAIAAAAGQRELAIDTLRQVVSGSAERSDRWFRAKVVLIELLAKIDVAKARTLLAQHRQLHPDLGPEPWRTRLLDVEREIGAAPPPDAPPPAPVAPAAPAAPASGGGA